MISDVVLRLAEKLLSYEFTPEEAEFLIQRIKERMRSHR